jgi:hypothetical protein
LHLVDTREKKALSIVEFYLHTIFKNLASSPGEKLFSPADTETVNGELSRILGDDADPLLQHLSLSAAMYLHIYRKLKSDQQLCGNLGAYSPWGSLSIAELHQEIEESYFPRNKIASLYFCEKLSSGKIAARLGINVNTVKYHLRYFNKKYPKKT